MKSKHTHTNENVHGQVDMHLDASKSEVTVSQHSSYIIIQQSKKASLYRWSGGAPEIHTAKIRTVAALGAVAAGKTWQLWLGRPDDLAMSSWELVTG